MVNRLSNLAEFLHSDSLPAWLKKDIEDKREEIFANLENGEDFLLSGPNGEKVKISPKPVPA